MVKRTPLTIPMSISWAQIATVLPSSIDSEVEGPKIEHVNC